MLHVSSNGIHRQANTESTAAIVHLPPITRRVSPSLVVCTAPGSQPSRGDGPHGHGHTQGAHARDLGKIEEVVRRHLRPAVQDYQRLRGRYEAPEEETEMLTGGGDYHRNGDLRDDEERMEGFDDSAFPVQRRSLNGSCAFECVLNAFGVVVYATLQHRQTRNIG